MRQRYTFDFLSAQRKEGLKVTLCVCVCVCVCASVVCDSLQPQGLQPTKLLCPLGFYGLQPTKLLCPLGFYGLQPTKLLCPLGFSRQEHWSGLPFPPPGNLPNPGIKAESFASLALAGRFFTPKPSGKLNSPCCCCLIAKSYPNLSVPWTATCQASLSFAIPWSLLKLISIESEMPSNHLILCCPLLLLPSIFPSIRGFSSESVLHIRWPKDWIFSISPSNE